MTRSITAIGVMLVLSACGSGGGVPTGVAPSGAASAATSIEGDLQLAARLYADEARTPPGFYAEQPRAGATYATVTHLRTTHLDPGAAPHELCTDDFGTAFAWDEAVAESQPVYGDLVENAVGERAYEFVRQLRSTPARLVVTRVYRCSYVDRTGADPSGFGPAGRFGGASVGTDAIRGLGEYLWTFTPDNNAGHAVLASRARERAADVLHELDVARLHRGPPGACDRVELWRVSLAAEREGGRLFRSETPVRTFGVARVQGVVQACTA